MVTKSDLDKAMADLKSQFNTQLAALRDHADLGVQQNDERMERRLAAAEEQKRVKEAQLQTNIVQTVVGCIREEMNARFATLESKVDRISSSSSGKGILPTLDQHLSTFRTTAVHETGHASIESSDFLIRESKFQFSRSNCPGFGGDNPIEWLRKCRSFFELHQVSIPYRTHLATLQFHVDASDWYDSYLLDHEPPGWDELVALVTTRFKRTTCRNTLDELRSLNQQGLVDDYWHQFQRLRSRMILEGRQFSERDFVDVFISGLKCEIKPLVMAFKPDTLDGAMEYVYFMESATDSQFKKLKGQFRLPSYSNQLQQKLPNDKAPNQQITALKLIAPRNNSKSSLIEQRRALGQYFRCGDRYFSGHQCKV
jgi:Ty3 transposon capsid-like protein